MSTRTVLRPSFLDSLDMSASSASEVTILQSLSIINYAVSWSGSSPTGTLALQFSDDYQLAPDGITVLNVGTWNSVPLDVNGVYQTSISISGNTGNGMIDVDLTGAYACRLYYMRSGGSGTMTVVVTGKVA